VRVPVVELVEGIYANNPDEKVELGLDEVVLTLVVVLEFNFNEGPVEDVVTYYYVANELVVVAVEGVVTEVVTDG